MIVVIDYNMGNPGSIVNMLKKIGAPVTLSSSLGDIEKADKLILPGVGAFDAGMRNLNSMGLSSILTHKCIEEKTPILGICLGMQLLTTRSEEGTLPGLGWIDAETIKFSFSGTPHESNKIPHMGWNTIQIVKESPLFTDIDEEPRFYFVHSYHVRCEKDEDILTTTFYGYDFVSAFMRDNILGVQFHPEKSHKFGLKLLNNFVHKV